MTTTSATVLSVPDIDPDADTLTAALAYTGAGFYVLPVDPNVDGKHPGSVVGNRWPSKSSRDPKQIAAWFTGTDYRIALHCGRSGVIAFDIDHPENTPTALTEHRSGPFQNTRPEKPERGHHLFLMPPDRMIGNSNGKLGKGWGDVRGCNGVIILAPAPGRRWIRTGPIPTLPDTIAALLSDTASTEDAATDAAVAAFLDAHQGDSRPEVIGGWRAAWNKHIADGAARHASMVSVLTGAMKEARAGYFPAAAAEHLLREVFVAAKTRTPIKGETQLTPQSATAEFAGILAWAVAQANSADVDDIRARLEAKMPSNVEEVDQIGAGVAPPIAVATVAPMSLTEAHDVFCKWLGKDYDTGALDAMIATAACERFPDGSDPVWLLIVGGPGNAKTETAQACDGIGAIVTSSISSEAALLSATPKRERAKSATGGLLRKIGDSGVLVIKDVTSILSMNRDLRARVLAALREIYDGRWYREVGTDGGMTIPWQGRLAVIGAVTTAWDTAHGVVSSMGDRFVLVRLDSTVGRQAAGRKAIGNTGSERSMRAELAAAVAGVIAGMNLDPITVTEHETDVILAAADLVTLARTGVEYDYRGDVIDAHAPEMPTRFAKQLTQIVRGAVAVGMNRRQALELAIRCARDSMPPLRLALIDDLAQHPGSTTGEVRTRVDKPRVTVDRQLQALHILGVATVEEIQEFANGKTKWLYSLAPDINPGVINVIAALETFPEMSVHTPSPSEEERKGQSEESSSEIGTDISGKVTAQPAPTPAACSECGLELGKAVAEGATVHRDCQARIDRQNVSGAA